eukprot:9470349-Pyramimonas_sp.AAC.1
MSQSLTGKETVQRLQERAQAVRAAQLKSQSQRSPEQKKGRYDKEPMATDHGAKHPEAGQFAPAPTFPGLGSGANSAEPSAALPLQLALPAPALRAAVP